VKGAGNQGGHSFRFFFEWVCMHLGKEKKKKEAQQAYQQFEILLPLASLHTSEVRKKGKKEKKEKKRWEGEKKKSRNST